MPNVIQPIRSRANILTKQWANGVRATGGGFQSNSVVIANNFVSVLVRKSYYSKIKYLLPMLGAGINAARVPLVDVLGVGAATNVNFVDADFSQSLGLQGDGGTKMFDSLVNPGQLGSTNNGGFGWWENNINFGGTGTECMGNNTSAADRFVLDFRSGLRFFSWGNASNAANSGTPATNGHFYGQRSSATNRILDFNGSLVVSNSTNDAAASAGERSVRLVGSDENGALVYWAGRCALTYMTDGTMADGEIADFNSILASYLMIPSGKPLS